MRPVLLVALVLFGAGESSRDLDGPPASALSGSQSKSQKLEGREKAGSSFKVHGSAGGLRHGAQGPSLDHDAKPKLTGPDTFLTFVTSNEYAPVTGTPWNHLAEPHRMTSLRASSSVGDVDRDVFTWSLGDGVVLEGREVSHMFTTVGRQRISVTQTVVSTGKQYRLEGSVMVKYVRREIRQLTQKDREAFFDAMETLYRLPTSDGNALYGDDYKGIEFFVQMHLDGAGVRDCDHWHDDAGIMTHHVGYTLLFEQALQLVNPAVSIPYWEYTIEVSNGMDSYGESEVFSHDWFGTASPSNSMHTVDTGRWAFLEIKKESWDYVHNAYGLLRTPWNVDGTPYVTRHNMTSNQVATSMVSCETYNSCFRANDLADMNNCLNGGTHGPVHIMMGGEWNDPEESLINAVGYSEVVPLMTKYLWRKGYLRTPETCTVEEHGVGDESTCRAGCPSEVYEALGMTEYDVLIDTNTLQWVAQFSQGTIAYNSDTGRFEIAGHEDDKDFQDAFWKKMLLSFCDPGHVGELFTSSAPYDPLFWVIHPTAERFLNWRRKLGRDSIEGYSFDETWGYTHGDVVGETGVICDWSGVDETTVEVPTCVKGICGGHKAYDILPFEINIGGKVQTMSNIEWLDFIYPDNEELPYLYNEYRWDHCVADGYSMGTMD